MQDIQKIMDQENQSLRSQIQNLELRLVDAGSFDKLEAQQNQELLGQLDNYKRKYFKLEGEFQQSKKNSIQLHDYNEQLKLQVDSKNMEIEELRIKNERDHKMKTQEIKSMKREIKKLKEGSSIQLERNNDNFRHLRQRSFSNLSHKTLNSHNSRKSINSLRNHTRKNLNTLQCLEPSIKENERKKLYGVKKPLTAKLKSGTRGQTDTLDQYLEKQALN